MISIDRILCPIDFTEFSSRALEHAVALARWYEATLTVLHVYSVYPVANVIPSLGVGGVQSLSLRESDREQILVDMRELASAAGAGPTVDLRLQEAPDVRHEILAQAGVLQANLIVMGSHGRSGFDHLLLGSTTEKILRKARCPVMVVPRHAGDHPVVPVMPFKRVLCPVDFSDASLRAVTWALSLAQESDAELLLLHAIELPPELHELRDARDIDVGGVRAAAEATCLHRLRDLVPESARTYCTVRTEVVEGSAHREIVRTARAGTFDLIVMGVAGRTGLDLTVFGSNTHAVLRNAVCPVLTVGHGS
jgi:nucleotide-binding universal stress UspA family protein